MKARTNYDVLFFNSSEEFAIPFLMVAALLLALFSNYCINVNTFSLHGMYRMRLVRAFLGASNFGRDADRFTNFDKSDNIPQAELRLISDAPIHVINTALNLVNTRKQCVAAAQGRVVHLHAISVRQLATRLRVYLLLRQHPRRDPGYLHGHQRRRVQPQHGL